MDISRGFICGDGWSFYENSALIFLQSIDWCLTLATLWLFYSRSLLSLTSSLSSKWPEVVKSDISVMRKNEVECNDLIVKDDASESRPL